MRTRAVLRWRCCWWAPLLLVQQLGCSGVKAEEDELDMSFIQGGAARDTITWDMLSGNYVPGQYLLEVLLNGRKLGKYLLEVTSEERDELCLSSAWLARAGVYLEPAYFEKTEDEARQCYHLARADAVQVDFDVSTQTLSLSIPQRGLGKAPVKTDWDYGTSALRVNYSANANANQVDRSAFGSASLKANVGKWVFNGSSSVSEGQADVSIMTASRALQDWQADLVLGRTYVGEATLGGVGINGVTLSHNNRMQPGGVGYAPVFSGVANTHARVTLSQLGRTLYSEMVPPGPFAITDVALLGSGDVEMLIIEDDGRERRQLFPLTVISGLVKPGQHEYSVSAGVKDSKGNEKETPGAMGSFSYGYGLEAFTLRTGGILHSDYQGLSAGVVSSLGEIGGVSLEGAYSRARYTTQPERRGGQVKLGYSKTFSTATTLQATWSRLLSPDFTEFSSFYPSDPELATGRRVHNSYSTSVSQAVGRLFTLGVSGWQRDYWDSELIEQGVTGSVGTTIANVGVSLAGAYSHGSEYGDNYSLSLSVSVPFSLFGSQYSLSNTVSTDKAGRVYASTGMSGSFNERMSYSISGGGGNDGSRQASLSSGYQADKAAFYMNVNQTDGAAGSSTTGSVSVNGSILALPEQGTVLLSRNISDTVGVVHVPQTAGVRVSGGFEETDSGGSVVVPLTSYVPNQIAIDAATLPASLELGGTMQEVIPTAQSVVWMPFEALHVKRYVLQVRERGGGFVPSGTWALNAGGSPLGFTAPNGVLLLNLVDKPGAIELGSCRIAAAAIRETDQLQEVLCEE